MPDTIIILCVDDELQILHTLERFCRNEGFTILTAQSVEQALTLLGETRVDVIISDYQMPFQNGLELLRTVQQRWPAVFRIMLSGCIDNCLIEQSLQSGEINAFLPKPWQREQLKSLLNTEPAVAADSKPEGILP